MKKIKALGVMGLFATAALLPNSANAWGHLGHQTIATIASQLVPNKFPFWSANASGMGTLTNVPDVNWKVGASAANEKPNHWFQIDSYTSTPLQFIFPHVYSDAIKKYKEPVVISNGTAPWRIKQFYDLAVAAFKKRDYATGLQMAGAMSHYIGDLSQPLHVSKNYDGADTNDPGIHKFFEATNLEATDAAQLSTDVMTGAKKLLGDPTFLAHFKGTIVDAAFDEINRAYGQKDNVISIDLKLGRGAQGSAALLALAKTRMADGIATLTVILSSLSADANLGNNAATVAVTVPAWIAPQFIQKKTPKSFYQQSEAEDFIASLNADDCDQ